MKKRSQVLFVISLGCIFGVSLCYAETVWEKRQKVLQDQNEQNVSAPNETTPVEQEKNKPVALELIEENPFNITVPAEYGSVIESSKGTNGKLIVHIQDAHANYEAQKNIAGIIESLITNYNITLVLMEGKATDRDFKYLRYRAPLDVRKDIADNLLKEGVFNGVNYLDLASSYPILIQGVEDKNLYDINGVALWDMDKFKDQALEYAAKLMSAADSIKIKIYNADLLAMDKAKKDYEDEILNLMAYYKSLNNIIQKKNIGVTEFQNFSNLIRISELEQKIDLAKIKNGKASDNEKKLYDEYQEALKRLNINKLFKEEPLLENKIQEAVSENEDQKTLYRISKALSIIDKMLNIKLVPEEYGYFLENKNDFDAKTWADFLKKKSDALGLNLDIPANHYAISDNMPAVEKFYSSAMDRENAFISKSEDRMKKDNIKSAILIAGGFHTPTLTQLLNDKGYSYIVISPKVTTKTDDNLYRQTLKRQWAPGIE